MDLLLVPLTCALVILAIHAYLGLHVIARGVIFVDLAFAQIAALGATVGLLFGVEHGTVASLGLSLVFTLVGALLFSVSRMEESLVPQEAIIGITYVVASAAVLLIAGFTAEGAEHVSETLTGLLIWVGWDTVLTMAGIYAVVGAILYLLRRPLLAVSFDPERAGAIRFWDFVFYALFGLVISLSVAVAGVLMVFSALVIPAVIAFLFTDRLGPALLVAWGSGTVAIVGGIVTSFAWDVPTGPLLVCSFGLVLILAFLVRAVVKPRPGLRVRVKLLDGGEPVADTSADSASPDPVTAAG